MPDLTRYRDYVLIGSLDTVAAAGGVKAATAKTVHDRPALIQELIQRIPYSSHGDERADPVREIALDFYNDALYQIVVRYDRTRTEGLTRTAIGEAVGLNAAEAPQRATDQREKDSGEAQSLLDRARLNNKAAFRP
jgi:hypothetical protein